jgi:hypothetical protein
VFQEAIAEFVDAVRIRFVFLVDDVSHDAIDPSSYGDGFEKGFVLFFREKDFHMTFVKKY